MKQITKPLLIIFLSLFSIQTPLFADPALNNTLAIASKAPDFSLLGADGKEHKLSDYLGKTVVLEWFNHDCPFVKKHYHSAEMNMQRLQKAAADSGVVWISINSSAEGKQGYLTAEQAVEITEKKKGAPTALLLDPNGIVGKLYHARTTPHMFIVDGDGILRYMGAIDNTPSTDVDDIAESKNYVSQALKELAQNKPVSEPITEAYGCSVKYGL